VSRSYSITAANVSVAGTGPSTMVFVQAPSSAPIVVLDILRAWASQAANATSAQQRIQISRQVSTFPTLTSATPTPLSGNDPASKIVGGTAGAAGTCGINASAEGSGAKTVIYPDAFNVLNGWLYVPTPFEVITESAQSTAEGLGIVFPANPTTTTNWNVGLDYVERG
jgi:hypothetical protein